LIFTFVFLFFSCHSRDKSVRAAKVSNQEKEDLNLRVNCICLLTNMKNRKLFLEAKVAFLNNLLEAKGTEPNKERYDLFRSFIEEGELEEKKRREEELRDAFGNSCYEMSFDIKDSSLIYESDGLGEISLLEDYCDDSDKELYKISKDYTERHALEDIDKAKSEIYNLNIKIDLIEQLLENKLLN